MQCYAMQNWYQKLERRKLSLTKGNFECWEISQEFPSEHNISPKKEIGDHTRQKKFFNL